MTDIKTESLKLTISNIPSELLDLIWDGVNTISNKHNNLPIDKTSNINFDCEKMEDEVILKLVGTIIATHCTSLNLNK